MPRGYRQSRRDSNHTEIVQYLRETGFSVVEVHSVAGALDLVLGIGGIDVRAEVKDGTKPPSARRLTEAEQRTMAEWKGRPPVILTSLEDCDTLRGQLFTESLDRHGLYE
jgi:hypothetical protein